jgi:hypothetical protein
MAVTRATVGGTLLLPAADAEAVLTAGSGGSLTSSSALGYGSVMGILSAPTAVASGASAVSGGATVSSATVSGGLSTGGALDAHGSAVLRSTATASALTAARIVATDTGGEVVAPAALTWSGSLLGVAGDVSASSAIQATALASLAGSDSFLSVGASNSVVISRNNDGNSYLEGAAMNILIQPSNWAAGRSATANYDYNVGFGDLIDTSPGSDISHSRCTLIGAYPTNPSKLVGTSSSLFGYRAKDTDHPGSYSTSYGRISRALGDNNLVIGNFAPDNGCIQDYCFGITQYSGPGEPRGLITGKFSGVPSSRYVRFRSPAFVASTTTVSAGGVSVTGDGSFAGALDVSGDVVGTPTGVTLGTSSNTKWLGAKTTLTSSDGVSASGSGTVITSESISGGSVGAVMATATVTAASASLYMTWKMRAAFKWDGSSTLSAVGGVITATWGTAGAAAWSADLTVSGSTVVATVDSDTDTTVRGGTLTLLRVNA